jgi:tetratricopeptide (TPR) repeat protein
LKGLILSWVLLIISGNLCQAQNLNTADTLDPVDSNIIESLIREHTKSKLEYKIVETRELLNQAKNNKDQKEVGDLMLMLGSLYMETGKFDASLQTLDELNSITTDDTVRLKIYYNKASLFRMALRYDDAIEELMQLRKLNKKVGNQTVEAYALNQIGVIYAMQKSTDVAQKYINESLAIGIENNDYACMANAYSNLASFSSDADSSISQYAWYVHKALHYYGKIGNKKYLLSLYNDMVMRFWKEEMHDSVNVYLNKIVELMPEVDFPEEIARIGVNLFLMGKIQDEEIILRMFDRLQKDGFLKNNIEIFISYHYFKYKLEVRDKHFEEALASYEKYKSATDSLYMRINTEKINIIEKNFALEKEQETLKRKNQQRLSAGIIILLLFLLVIVLLILIVVNHRSKIRKASREQHTLQTKLEGKNKEMVAYLMQLIKIKETNNKIINYLKTTSRNLKKEESQVVNSMIADLRDNANNDFWTDFNLRFKDVNREFYQKLNDQYPNLTLNEHRLCAFLYLDMSTKEVANITGQSVDSINLARTRLRRKLGLTSTPTPINSFLQNL